MVSPTASAKPSRRPSVSLVYTGVSGGDNRSIALGNIVSETIVVERTASRPGLALIDALRRCHGELIAIASNVATFSDDALETAVAAFSANPDAGGICFEEFLLDEVGAPVADVNLVTLLLKATRLRLPAGFLRRSALLSVGLEREDWTPGSEGLDLWCRIATDFEIVSLQRRALQAPIPAPVFEPDMSASGALIEDRLRLIGRHFSSVGFFEGKAPEFELESKLCQILSLRQEFQPKPGSSIDRLLTDKALLLLDELHQLLQVNHRALPSLYRLISARSRGRVFRHVIMPVLGWLARSPSRFAVHLGYSIWNAPHKSCPFLGHWLMRTLISRAPKLTSPGESSDAASLTEAYTLAGIQYEARGQIVPALAMWKHARDDVTIDSLACQAHLKNPSATDESLADVQRNWVARHIGNEPHVILPRAGDRPKIRIGYHCAFMGNDTIRHMMRNVFLAHDRARFEVFGYSPRPVPSDISTCFDVLRITPSPPTSLESNLLVPSCSDEEFLQLVRKDSVDVLVELTGFSPGHRFSPMARRCAPVQISYLNHAGTTQVPNVDYVLSDELSTPAERPIEAQYSERIYRLPGCFFSFDYTSSEHIDISAPPHRTSGHVTFGCFGSGGKINLMMVEWWAAILHSVPSSKLHLRNMQLDSVDNRRFMRDRFARYGIESDRLILGEGVSRERLWHLYSQIDISLDTWPYCGGNTIGESLWQGVPVVTMRGDRFAASYGASLLSAAGCHDLIAETPAQYVEIAGDLASDSTRLSQLRRDLRQMSIDYGLGDSKQLARNLEEAFQGMLNPVDELSADIAGDRPLFERERPFLHRSINVAK